MRTLTAPTITAIQGTGRQPSAGCKVADDHEHWTLFRNDAPAKSPIGTAAGTASDGSLIRAVLFDNGGGGNADLSVAQVR